MARGDTRLLVSIEGNNSDFLRSIASSKAAMHGLRGPLSRLTHDTKEHSRETRELNRLLDRQRRAMKGLTGDFVALRNAMRTLALRGAITGFAALSGVVTSLGADVVKLTDQVGLLGTALGVTTAVGLGGALQAFGVYKAGLKGVGKALTTTGHQHDLAMQKLTKAQVALVKSLGPLRKGFQGVQVTAANALSPGLTSAAKRLKGEFVGINDIVWNTGRAMGYLADHAAARVKTRFSEIQDLARLQTITFRRGGDSLIEWGDTWVTVATESSNMVRTISSDVLHWSRDVRRSVREAKKDGSLSRYFADATRSWKIWTSTIGATGGTVAGVLGASRDSAFDMAKSIEKAAKSAERWAKSDVGQEKMKRGFDKLKPVSAEIAKTLGAIGATLVDIGIHGSDSATRILGGFRTEVLPLIKELSIAFNDGLLQAVIDLSRETVEFLRGAQPGFSFIAARVADIASAGADVLGFINGMVDRMPAFNQAVAGLAIGAGIILSWQKLKLLMESSLLAVRQMVGLAPKLTAVATATNSVAGRAGGGVIAGARAGSPGRGATTPSGSTIIASSPFMHSPRMANQLIVPPEHYINGPPQSARRGTMPTYDSKGGIRSMTPLPRAITQTRTHTPGLARLGNGPRGPQFFPLNIAGVRDGSYPSARYQMPALAPMPGVRGGDPLTGIRGGGSATDKEAGRRGKAAGRFSLVRQAAGNSVVGVGQSVKQGFMSGTKAAMPAVKGIMKIGVFGSVLGGLIGAFSSTDLKNTVATRLGGALSGLTFGALPSPDARASDQTNTALQAISDKGKFKLDARSDAQRGLISKFKTDTLNLAKPADLLRLKEWVAVSAKANKLTREQATAIKAAADAQTNYVHKVGATAEAQKKLGKSVKIDPSDVTSGLDLLTSGFISFRKKSHVSIQDARDFVHDSMKRIKKSMVDGSESAKSATAGAFNDAALAIKKSLHDGYKDGKKETRDGLAEIERLMTAKLKMFGFNSKEAANITRGQRYDGGKDEGAGGKTPGKAARGGFYIGRPGERGRDEVPMQIGSQKVIAARGEYVGILNGEQQQAFDDMAHRSGYGGIKGFFESHNTPHSKTRRAERGGIFALGNAIKRRGPYTVGENKYFGGVHGSHAHYPPNDHYSDSRVTGAIDVNADGAPGGEPLWLDRLAKWLSKEGWHYLWRVAGHQDHLHADTAGGIGQITAAKIKRVLADGTGQPGVDAIAQAALDRVRGGANDVLSSLTTGATSLEGGESAPASGDGAALMRQIAKARGWNFADWWALDASETGHGKNLSNPTSTARLRGQFLDMNWGKYGPGSDPAQNPTMAQQIQSMADYIGERWGNPTKAWAFHQIHNWYDKGGIIAASAGKPPLSNETAPVPDLDDAQTKPSPSKDKKKKDKKKDKDKPYYAPNVPKGVAQAIANSKKLLSKGKGGKLKTVKPRIKVRGLATVLKGGKWIDDPDFVDPLTGEARNPEDMPMFSVVRKLREAYPGLVEKMSRMTDDHGLIDTASTLSLDDTTGDLTRWLKSQGMSAEQIKEWINVYGKTLDVTNLRGFEVHGKFWGGLDQFGGMTNDEITAHLAIQGNWQSQSDAAKGINTAKQLGFRRSRLAEIHKIFTSNREVIKTTAAKLKKAKKPTGWRTQVADNTNIINALRRHKRDSSNLPKGYRTRIDHQIDDLTDLNRELREKKPKRTPLGMDRVLRLHEQRVQENAMISGNRETNGWITATQGSGLAGAANQSVTNWKAMDEYRGGVIEEARTGVADEDFNIRSLRKSLDDFKTAGWLPPPEKLYDGDKARDDILKQIGLDSLRQRRLGDAERDTLSGFAQLLGMRSIGAFSHGAVRIAETGMALVHRNETIIPDQDGPFRNGMTMNRLAGESGSGDVYLVADGDLAALFDLIDVRVRRGTAKVSAQQGRKTRAIRTARGG